MQDPDRGTAAAAEAMTLSEEQLHVGTRTRPYSRLRARKRIVTEEVTQTVERRREEFVLDEDPITESGGEQTDSSGELAESSVEFVLYEERVRVVKEIVPVERVRVSTVIEAGRRDVSADVRREEIELETDSPT